MHKLMWRLLVLGLVLVLSLGPAACRQQADPQVEPEVTGEEGAAPVEEEAEEAEAVSKVPLDTFVQVTIGEPESLDPAWTYETSGGAIETNIYEGMVYFDREKPDEFVPALATDWRVSDDGTVYTFDIRDGVSFHAGGMLEPHDIAYTIQRAMLQDRIDGPMWLFLEPFLGVSSIEGLALETAGLAEDEEATIADVPEDVATAVCEIVKAGVVADDEAGTVTLTVLEPTPWLLQLLAQQWVSTLDMEWIVEQGGWDGDCATWTLYHSPAAEESVLFNVANGTGPYMLDSWKPGQEITLEANPTYWRTENDPVWEGGPAGPPALTHIVIQQVDEWGTRFAKLSAGEADIVVVPRAEISQVDPMVHTQYTGGDANAPAEVMNEDGSVNLFIGYPTVAATAAMFNFAINDEGGNDFIGSAALDGEGIPPDFFSDLNVRRGFSYCFDWETFIEMALQGEGFQTRGPIIMGMDGYREDNEIYTYDLDKCAEQLELAWDGAVAENGFFMRLAYNEGNDARKTASEILAENLALVGEQYQVEVVSLEWPSFLDARRNRKLPISVSGWLEDYHDASNWAHPFTHSAGAYARAQSFPEEIQTQFDDLFNQAVTETDMVLRDELFAELQQLAIDEAISVFLYQATGRTYMNKQVKGWFAHDLKPGMWFYGLSKSE